MLETKSPEHWARHATLDELWSAIRAVRAWSEEVAQLVDFAFQERCVRLLGRQQGAIEGDADALSDLIERTAHDGDRDALDALERPYAARWRLMAELVQRFALRLEVPRSVLARKHVAELLVALHRAGGRLPQRELAPIIGNEGQRSATLKLMEEWDLIERTADGHGNARTVAITTLGRLAIADRVALDAAAAPEPPRLERFVTRMTSPALA